MKMLALELECLKVIHTSSSKVMESIKAKRMKRDLGGEQKKKEGFLTAPNLKPDALFIASCFESLGVCVEIRTNIF